MPSHLFIKTSTLPDGNMSPGLGDPEVVPANRHAWLKKIGTSEDSLCIMDCNQGERIVVVIKRNFQNNPQAEALITNEPDLALGLTTADCIPAIFFDPKQNVLALAHLNRRTIQYDLAKKVLAKMSEVFKTQNEDVLVHFEPHIHADSYYFPAPLTDPTAPQLENYIFEKSGNVHVNFASAHKAQLVEAGILEKNITVSPINVATSPDYFSYHQSKRDPKKPKGGHLTVVSLKKLSQK